jgi:hypothetical protein
VGSIRRLSLVAAVGMAVMPAQPTAAFHVLDESGKTGEYTINDTESQPGALCLFENNPGSNHDELNAIRIRKLWSHGPFPQDSLVGFRYIVQRDAPPFGDGFQTRFRSRIVKKSANDAEVAFFGPVTWKAPEGTNSHWRVRIALTYYAKGSSSNVIGHVSGNIEVYRSKLKASNLSFQEGGEGNAWYCRAEFFPIPA